MISKLSALCLVCEKLIALSIRLTTIFFLKVTSVPEWYLTYLYDQIVLMNQFDSIQTLSAYFKVISIKLIVVFISSSTMNCNLGWNKLNTALVYMLLSLRIHIMQSSIYLYKRCINRRNGGTYGSAEDSSKMKFSRFRGYIFKIQRCNFLNFVPRNN